MGALTGCAIAQNQFQTRFQDYDYPQEQSSSQRARPPARQSPRRGQAPDTRGQPTTPRAETTTNVAILKQINEYENYINNNTKQIMKIDDKRINNQIINIVIVPGIMKMAPTPTDMKQLMALSN